MNIYLRTAFSSASGALGEFIREQRLDGYRTTLKGFSLPGHAVSDVALKWGFNDPAYFSRVYKARFGISSRDEVLQRRSLVTLRR